MTSTPHTSAGLPSKKPGKSSGGGRDNKPPKVNAASNTPGRPPKMITREDVGRIKKSPAPDIGFVMRATIAADKNQARKTRD